ncbi:hypothetical protein TrVGV298_002254 [Trichoderma virens]|nr:hypothetical protein TrVGV298_002254 [Trichoderma virens]
MHLQCFISGDWPQHSFAASKSLPAMHFFGSGTKAARSEADTLWFSYLYQTSQWRRCLAPQAGHAGPAWTKEYRPSTGQQTLGTLACWYPASITPRHSPRACFVVQSLHVSRDPVVRCLR